MNYKYNIRGWLTHINDADRTDAADHFGMELYYDFGYDENYYNGNIAGVKWQSALDDQKRTYGYIYDHVNRITGADYAAQGTGGGALSWNASALEAGNHSLDQVSYDRNGNIRQLKRYGLVDDTRTLWDDMTYSYSGNQLQKVDDLGQTAGFSDDDNSDPNLDDYLYDENGNLTKDENKDITEITYNHLNLPETVTFEDGNQILYTYDATGVKHKQEVIEGGQTTKTTEYLGEFIYENDTLVYIQHEEGRVVPDTSGFEYQYYHKDHLGNIRMTFTAPKAAVEYLATMETANATSEEAEFGNIAETRQLDALQAYNGVASARLNGFDNRIIGPSKSLAIGKGDTVKIEVYAKYNQTTNNTTTLVGGLAAAVTDAFGLVSGITETQVAYDAISSLLSAGSGLVSSNDDIPLAYVNYLMFNEDYLLVDFGYQQVSTTALNNPHELLSISTVAPQNGFMYIYLTNESALDLDVFFDELKITHTESPIIQEDHYYPYGLSMRGIGKEGNNPWKYNGKELQDELQLGLYDYQARYYDPALGRFINIDPAADLMRRHSPYNYAFDNPIRFTDPDGMVPIDPQFAKGFGKGVLNAFKEIGNFVAETFNTRGQNLVEAAAATRDFAVAAVEDPSGTFDAVVDAAEQGIKNSIVENGGVTGAVGEIMGNASVGVVAGILGDKGLSKVKNIAKISNKLGGNTNGVNTGTDFVVTPKGEAIKIPDGAKGPTKPEKGSGMMFDGGSGGKGMNKRTTGVRIMDANRNQSKRVNHMNKQGQTVDPVTGKTISNKDTRGHVPLKDF